MFAMVVPVGMDIFRAIATECARNHPDTGVGWGGFSVPFGLCLYVLVPDSDIPSKHGAPRDLSIFGPGTQFKTSTTCSFPKSHVRFDSIGGISVIHVVVGVEMAQPVALCDPLAGSPCPCCLSLQEPPSKS
eukprot:2279873-Amphidinium_carterae.1